MLLSRRRCFWNFPLWTSRSYLTTFRLRGTNFVSTRGSQRALLCRRCRFRSLLLWTVWRHVAALGLSRARFIAACRSEGTLFLVLRPLLFVWSDALPILLLQSLVVRPSLVLARLTVVRLLIIPLLITSGRRHSIATLLIAPLLILPLILSHLSRLIVVAAVIASHIFRRTRFADDIAYRARREIVPRGAANGLDARPAVLKHCTLPAADIDRSPVEIVNHPCPINDPRIVYDKVTAAAEMILEAMNVTEGKE